LLARDIMAFTLEIQLPEVLPVSLTAAISRAAASIDMVRHFGVIYYRQNE
jgi:hypothetical protein